MGVPSSINNSSYKTAMKKVKIRCAPEVIYPWSTEIDDMRPFSVDKTNCLFTDATSAYGCIDKIATKLHLCDSYR